MSTIKLRTDLISYHRGYFHLDMRTHHPGNNGTRHTKVGKSSFDKCGPCPVDAGNERPKGALHISIRFLTALTYRRLTNQFKPEMS